MFKKFLVLSLALCMVIAMTACGEDKKNTTNNASEPTKGAEATPEPTEAPKPSFQAKDGALNFEDGNFGFAAVAFKFAECDLATNLSVADFAGSKALVVKSPVSDNIFSGKLPFVAIDVNAVLGAKAADVASIEYVIGTQCKGEFAANSGYIAAVQGGNETKKNWSVYLEEENPKQYKFDLETKGFAEGDYIYFAENSSGNVLESKDYDLILDNITFLDASGNVIAADASKTFAAAGVNESFWLNLDWSNGVKQPKDEVILGNDSITVGMLTKEGSWWPQCDFGKSTTNMLTFTELGAADEGNLMFPVDRSLFVPGTVITVYYNNMYTVDDGNSWQYPFFRIQTLPRDEFPQTIVDVKTAAGAKDPVTGEAPERRNESMTIVQFTYDDIIHAMCNEKSPCKKVYTDINETNWYDYADMFGLADMGGVNQIYKITIGKISE